MKVVIAGGGTAGHVNPALALARALEGHDVVFIGTSRGAEAKLVPAAGFRLELLDVAGFDRGRPWALPWVGLKAAAATFRAARLLGLMRPDVVVGMGGYVSLPVGLAARMRGIPVVLHEQNAVLGLANRVLKRSAVTVAVSFEEALAQAGPRGRLVGNPVAPELVVFDRVAARKQALDAFGLDPARKTLLVFGGSQGALRINEAARELAVEWQGRSDRQVVHISGSKQARLDSSGDGLIFRSVEFVDQMAQAYAVADLALCRGGAATVAELCVVGLPAVIVPYPYHRDRQQEKHARVLEKAGAARVLADAETDGRTVAELADRMLDADETLEQMRAAALTLARPEAGAALALLVAEAAQGSEEEKE